MILFLFRITVIHNMSSVLRQLLWSRPVMRLMFAMLQGR